MLGAELEKLLRALVREEVSRIMGTELTTPPTADDDDLRQLAVERAAKHRRVKAR